jgi:predicted rRNA methylase YqxC with S4 and FtsJ domains
LKKSSKFYVLSSKGQGARAKDFGELSRAGQGSRVKDQEVSRESVISDSVFLDPCYLTLATMDVSFISITKILPAIYAILEKDGEVVSLVKPQFEAGRGEVPRGGVVKDPKVHQKVLETVKNKAEKIGFKVKDVCDSPILGADGNREFFVWLIR